MVLTFSVHQENGEHVYFTPASAPQLAETPMDTTLTGFYTLCQDKFAWTLLYNQEPSYYTWNKIWNYQKKQDVKKNPALGKVYTTHPGQEECFFLRMLLHDVKGPTSFDMLHPVASHVCGIYREAFNLHGLLEDDAHWDVTR